MNKEKIKSLGYLSGSMVIFGTIGLFRRYIDMPSSVLAMVRGIIGSVFLIVILIFMRAASIKKSGTSADDSAEGALGAFDETSVGTSLDNSAESSRKSAQTQGLFDRKAISTNLVKLLISGAMIGLNWILLFEAYRFTTVSIATLCYYMSPIFVILLSPIFLKAKLTVKKIICTLFALMGMVLVSGVLTGNSLSGNAFIGILLGLGAAVLYASVVMVNQCITDIGAFDKTIMQLSSAALITIPYILITGDYKSVTFSISTVLLTIFVGLVHTGIAYAMFFKSMSGLEAQTVALFAYIDPVVALILSALILREHMGIAEIIGAVLILGSAVISETGN